MQSLAITTHIQFKAKPHELGEVANPINIRLKLFCENNNNVPLDIFDVAVVN